MTTLTIRAAILTDMDAIQRIYAHHVIHGLASWEEEPPDRAEMIRRWRGLVADGFPYRVAARDGVVLGYAYANAYRSRSSYRYTVENSVYIDAARRRSGVGLRLLIDLIGQCEDRGFRRMVAVIGDAANAASIEVHTRAGFERVGIVPACGFKVGKWLDQVLMHRRLGPGGDTMP
jgi:phosphinothricin acetyltransferase